VTLKIWKERTKMNVITRIKQQLTILEQRATEPHGKSLERCETITAINETRDELTMIEALMPSSSNAATLNTELERVATRLETRVQEYEREHPKVVNA
jgi:hypothetical protein